MKWKWLLVLLPTCMGIILTILYNNGRLSNSIIFIRADIGTWLLLLGIALSVLIATVFAVQEWADRYQHLLQSQSAAERRRFLRRLDHELKNPLMAIRAGLANLSDSPDAQLRQQATTSIETQVLRLSTLSSDLRKLAELESRPIERSSVDLSVLLQEVYEISLEKPGAGDRHINLTIPQAPWPLSKISGDPDLLYLAVHNLMENAVKFSAPGSTVELRAFEDGPWIVIEVADTGPGIPQDEIPHVWEELYRGKGARGISGSGLGLSLVRTITDLHGGILNIRSREGQGTVVTLRLPISS